MPRSAKALVKCSSRGVLAISLAAAMVACAPIPAKDQAATIQDISSYQTSVSFAGTLSAWPTDRWWQDFGDAQLNSLIEEALRDSPDMAIAAARLHQAEANTQVAGATLLPKVGASGSVTEQRQSYNYLSPAAYTPQDWNDYGSATLDFSWEIDFWGKNRAGVAAATSDLQAQRAEQAQARLTLSTAIASRYAELARLFASRDTSEKAVIVRKRTAVLVAERYANGMENLGGVRQADAGLASAEGVLLLVDEQIGLERNRLAALLGAGPDRGLSIARPRIVLDHPPGLPSELAVNLLGRRPDVVATRLQAQAQASRIEQKQAEFYPNVNLVGFLGFQSLGLNLLTQNGSTVGSIGPALYLPIFTGGRLTGELQGARARYEEAVGNYNRTVTRALQEVADAALSKKALAPRLNKSQVAVAAATDAYQIARNRYEGSLSNYLDVLVAEDAMLTSMRALTDLQSRAFTLDVELTRALGGGYRHSSDESHS